MRVVTERGLIKSVLERWEAQYPRKSWKGITFVDGTTPGQVHDSLRLLDLDTATADDVATAIGNSSWTTDLCDECGTRVSNGIEIGIHESRVFICVDCAGIVADRWCVLKELTGGGL